jgi:hypothetical protein
MIGYLIAFAIGALASFAPSLYNLLGGGQQQATNAALGIPSAATAVSIITIIGLILLLVGLITFRGTQMVVGVILIIFAPQIASYIVNPPTVPTVTTTTPYPYYPPNPTTPPYPTTPYPTTPSQTDKCLIDPLILCPEELEYVWANLSLRIGEYGSSPLGFGARPNEGVFILIKTDRGWYWGGAQLQSVLTLSTTGVPTIDAIYIYLLGYNPGDSLYVSYWVDLKENSILANQYRILDVEYQDIRVNNKIQLVAVLKPGTNLDLNKFDYNKEYYMTITVKPIPKIAFFRGDVYFMYTVKVKRIASGSTGTTVSTVSSQNPFAYIYSTLQVAPPEYDINTGVNLQVLSAAISLTGLLVSIYTMNKMKGKRR